MDDDDLNPVGRNGQEHAPSSLYSCLSHPTVVALAQGQFISLLIAGTGVFASILTDRGDNFPVFMNLLNYLCCSLYLLRKFYRDRKASQSTNADLFSLEGFGEDPTESSDARKAPIRVSKWLYVIAALLDVLANFLVLEAYKYTSITSIMLLDCFTIPCVMFLSYFLLNCRYTTQHSVGVCLCLLGLSLIILNDFLSPSSSSNQPHAVQGDLLCLAGACCYATSNILQESLVKFTNREEYLGFLGLFGSLWAGFMFLFIDLHHVRTANWDGVVIGSVIGFVLCLFFMYSNTTVFLQERDATLFNLSLLTSDVYAVLFTFVFYGYWVHWMYFLAFAVTLSGLVVYHRERAPMSVGRETRADSTDSTARQKQEHEQRTQRSSRQRESSVELDDVPPFLHRFLLSPDPQSPPGRSVLRRVTQMLLPVAVVGVTEHHADGESPEAAAAGSLSPVRAQQMRTAQSVSDSTTLQTNSSRHTARRGQRGRESRLHFQYNPLLSDQANSTHGTEE